MSARAWLLLLACSAQLFVAGSWIWRAESALGGTAYRFETAPVDPVDWFRGRYVQLRFPTVSVPRGDDAPLRAGGSGFATLEVGEEGIARLTSVYGAPPAGVDSLRVEVVAVRERTAKVRLAFERFYMDEERAPAVERAMAQQRGNALAVVRVRDGEGVIEDLLVEGAEERQAAKAPLRERVSTPAGVTLPEGVVEAMQQAGPPNPELCGTSVLCVAFPVELDGEPGDEWVVTGPLSQLFYYRPEPDPPGRYRWHATLQQRRGTPVPDAAELLRLLEEPDAVAATAPPYRDLRLGRAVVGVPY